MKRSKLYLVSAIIGVVVSLHCQSSATAQGGRGNPRLFGTIPAVTLAQLEVVQKEAKLTDDQKTAAKELQQKMNADRMKLFQEAQGDFEKIRTGVTKLYDESFEALKSKLDESQVKRMQELYIQANQAMALADEPIQEMLKFTDEQKAKFEMALGESREEMFGAFPEFQSLSEEERAKRSDAMVDSRDRSLLAVLNESQRKAFEEAQGEKVEIDLSELPRPGRN